MREPITGSMTVQEVVATMSEGNPGAINVMMALIQSENGNVLDLLHFDDMNMRGPQIWIAFKDHCGQDLDMLLDCLRSRDSEMIATVNAEYSDEQAVKYGGSHRVPMSRGEDFRHVDFGLPERGEDFE